MTNYDVNVSKMTIKDERGNFKTEIWANITDTNTCEVTKKKIFWQDDEGVLHDETPKLPAYLRTAVDNAWLEKKRKW